MEESVITSQEPVIPKQTFKKKKFLIVAIVSLLMLLTIGGLILFNSSSSQTEKIVNSQLSIPGLARRSGAGINPSPTPFPFQEITIPYLRARSYKSNLGTLEQVSNNSEYTSYLASYDSEGFKVNGLLTIPKEGLSTVAQDDGRKYPAIIFVHGYISPQNYQTLVNYAAYVDYLARNGFVVFKIDLRGHAESEGEPGGGYYSADYIIDTLNARAALQTSDFVNPDAIGLWGHSMAGNVIARALAASPQIPAIVIWAGAVYTYTDFSEYSIEDNSYQPPPTDSPSRKKRNEMFEKYGQFDPNSDFWKQVPMTNYLDGIKGAISLNHALDDAVVDIRYSRNFNSLLDKTLIPHELNEYPSGGHNLSGAAFNQAMQKTVEFFKKYLK